MFEHLPKGRSERILPQVSPEVLKMRATTRAISLKPGLNYDNFCREMKRLWGFAANWRIKRDMYREYRTRYGLGPDPQIDRVAKGAEEDADTL